ncbi:protein of unknown function [Xenorhabdus doucetiae]|uniref:Uncharacterized protein n=1 Tax=Xenorhabdus doucetiae TaxID=351671 RepID=A0A068QPU8_9GAMM|nr:protein of unknown function [Xenorhabdus doucetiae]
MEFLEFEYGYSLLLLLVAQESYNHSGSMLGLSLKVLLGLKNPCL